MNAIEKSLLFCCLILVFLSFKFNLGMQEDLQVKKFQEIKENLIKAVNHNKYDEVQSAFDDFNNKMNEEVSNDPNQLQFTRKYLQDLIYQPLPKHPKGNSVMNLALEKQNLSILYLLLSKDRKDTETDFFNYLNQHLHAKIDPDNDPNYLKQIHELTQAINKNPEKAKIILENFQASIKAKFIDQSQIQEELVERYFEQEIWPIYKHSMDKQLKQFANTTLKKQDFAVLYFLFKYLGTVNQYIKYINNNIKPSDDSVYQKLKQELVQEVTSGEVKNSDKLLNRFIGVMHRTYIPPKLFQTSDIGEINQNYTKNILPEYKDDLLKSLLPIAIHNKNNTIIYILLDELIKQPLDKLPPFIHQQPFIPELIQLKDTILSHELDYIISISLAYLFKGRSSQIVDVLKHLKENGLEDKRLENIILQAFIYYGKTIADLKDDIKYLHDKKFISDLDQFEKDFIQYKILDDTYKATSTSKANSLLNQLAPEFVNKIIYRNTLLNHIIKNGSDQFHINLITNLVTKLHADVNLAGTFGLTPLINVVKAQDTGSYKTEVIKILLENGANIGAKDIFGKTALDYARAEGDQEIIKLIQDHTKQVSAPLPIDEQLLSLNLLNLILNSLANKV